MVVKRAQSPPDRVPTDKRRKRLGGVFVRKERWSLSWYGWLVLVLLVTATVLVAFLKIQPFLAVHRPVTADILVVEGWIPDHALKYGVGIFQGHNYRRLLTVGGRMKSSPDLVPDDTYAHFSARKLRRYGMAQAEMAIVETPTVSRDRTYASALAVRQWLETHNEAVKTINVLTLDVHARRSQLLFRQALSPRGITVGVIAAPNSDYDPKAWWQYSEGVREVTSEAIAYIYARCFFRPHE